LYGLFFTDFEALRVAFVLGAVSSYIEDFVAVVFSLLVGVPLALTMLRTGILRQNERE
jgi:hypothetical protein